jgi:hypothetical protein
MTICANCIAAGRSITEDVPEGALALGRSRQVTKPGWVAAKKPQKRRVADRPDRISIPISGNATKIFVKSGMFFAAQKPALNHHVMTPNHHEKTTDLPS